MNIHPSDVATVLGIMATLLTIGGTIASRTRISLFVSSHIALVRRVISLEAEKAQLKSQVANGETNARLATFTREEAERLEGRVDRNEIALKSMRKRIAVLANLITAWIAYTAALEALLTAAGIPLPPGRPGPIPEEDDGP